MRSSGVRLPRTRKGRPALRKPSSGVTVPEESRRRGPRGRELFAGFPRRTLGSLARTTRLPSPGERGARAPPGPPLRRRTRRSSPARRSPRARPAARNASSNRTRSRAKATGESLRAFNSTSSRTPTLPKSWSTARVAQLPHLLPPDRESRVRPVSARSVASARAHVSRGHALGMTRGGRIALLDGRQRGPPRTPRTETDRLGQPAILQRARRACAASDRAALRCSNRRARPPRGCTR
jgi:hypothetical protein